MRANTESKHNVLGSGRWGVGKQLLFISFMYFIYIFFVNVSESGSTPDSPLAEV